MKYSNAFGRFSLRINSEDPEGSPGFIVGGLFNIYYVVVIGTSSLLRTYAYICMHKSVNIYIYIYVCVCVCVIEFWLFIITR